MFAVFYRLHEALMDAPAALFLLNLTARKHLSAMLVILGGHPFLKH